MAHIELSAGLPSEAEPGLTVPHTAEQLLESEYRAIRERAEISWIATTGEGAVLHIDYIAHIELSAGLPAEAGPGLTVPPHCGAAARE